MKKITILVLAFAFASFGTLRIGLSDEERKMATDHLEQTHERVVKTIADLNEEQLHFKPTPESWSVAECVEHITISENMIGGMLQGALETPANPAMRDSVTMDDQKLIGMISSRKQKVKTSEAFEPSNQFGTHAETVEAFSTKRKEHIAYLKVTEDDLRNHYGQLSFGTIDGLQILLFMSGHTERHVQQMEEIMNHDDFPMLELPEPRD